MLRYYAVKPISCELKYVRIEKADSPRTATRLAFGGPLHRSTLNRYHWKDLGTRLSVLQSDKKRIALLEDPTGWTVLK